MKRLFCMIICLGLLMSLCSCSLLLVPFSEKKVSVHNELLIPIEEDNSLENEHIVEVIEEETVCARVEFERMYNDQYMEYAVICGYDEYDGLLWEHTTGAYEAAQVDRVCEIGLHNGRYYFSEADTILSMDAGTGEVLWTNDYYIGSITDKAFGDEAIYLCGYFGPDFFAISYDGEILCRIDRFDEDYFWASDIELTGNNAYVYMYGGTEDYDSPVVFSVDLDTYEYELG
ncbi:MAG: hypothetical protein IKT46_08690 [Clostridia bacterium]|nr:hypothetical protein [Clostridia bacterium]